MGIDILGVDFSGAAQPAEELWLTRGEVSDDGLTVTEVFDGSRWGSDREAIHGGLANLIREEPFDVVGLDFPFGLPRSLFDEDVEGWSDVLEWVRGLQPDPNAFREACGERGREATDGDRAQLRRETDWRRGGLCPYNVQVQYQTFFGLRNVLGPLSDSDDAAIVPQQGSPDGKTAVVEVYPAATFSRLGLYREGYKPNPDTNAAEARRKTNVQGLTDVGIDLDRAQFDQYVTDPDALDSLAAAHAAWTAVSDTRGGARSKTRAFEGYIYSNAEP